MFWADIVLNTENSSEDASATVSCALLSVVFFLPRFWRVNLFNFLTAAMLKCARREKREHQSCF